MTALVLAAVSALAAIVAACFSADSTALLAFGSFISAALTIIVPWSIDRAKRKALGGG